MLSLVPILVRLWPYALAAAVAAYPAYKLGHVAGHHAGVADGRVQIVSEQEAEAAKRKERSDEAQAAVDACRRDPACIMRDDPNRRPD